MRSAARTFRGGHAPPGRPVLLPGQRAVAAGGTCPPTKPCPGARGPRGQGEETDSVWAAACTCVEEPPDVATQWGRGRPASHFPPGLLGSWTKVPRCCSWFLWEVAGSSPLGSLQTQPVCLPALDSLGVVPSGQLWAGPCCPGPLLPLPTHAWLPAPCAMQVHRDCPRTAALKVLSVQSGWSWSPLQVRGHVEVLYSPGPAGEPEHRCFARGAPRCASTCIR